jgi:hypothetical protein
VESGENQVSTDITLTDVYGIPLPLEATIRVKYLDGRPVAYCVADEHWPKENEFVRYEGAFRPLQGVAMNTV